MRKLILDTETTGLSKTTNRIMEIGIIETIDNLPTGNYFHRYINPQMEVGHMSVKICGYSNDFLCDKPVFADIIHDLNEFIHVDPIVAHNAKFDMGFLNMERSLLNIKPFENTVIDTLEIARKIFPGAPCSLDALCKRFKVSLHKRDKHGALLDAELLTKVYFYLLETQSNEYALLEQDSEIINNLLVEFKRNPLIIDDINDKEEHIRLITKYKF
jgi:DNA polymerase-3 subunit epsilon